MIGCGHDGDSSDEKNIIVNYPGEYYIFLCNDCGKDSPNGKLYIGWGENETIWNYEKLKEIFTDLGKMEIQISKVIINGFDSGNLTLRITDYKNRIIYQDDAPVGTKSVLTNYDF